MRDVEIVLRPRVPQPVTAVDRLLTLRDVAAAHRWAVAEWHLPTCLVSRPLRRLVRTVTVPGAVTFRWTLERLAFIPTLLLVLPAVVVRAMRKRPVNDG